MQWKRLFIILLIGIPFNIYVWLSIQSDKGNTQPTIVKPEAAKTQSQSQQENASVIQRAIGGKLISIPSPKNWFEISSQMPTLFQTFEKLTLPPHRVVAAFISNTDKESSTPQFNRYILITASRDIEKMPDFPSSDFIKLKSQIKSHLKSQKDFFVKKFKEKYGSSFSISDYPYSLKINTVAPIGVFLDKRHALAQGSIVNTALVADIELTSSYENIAIGAATLWVKGKIFNVEVKSKFETEEDMTWVKAKTEELVDLILLAN